MKKTLFIAWAILASLQSFAQAPKAEYSSNFDEPEESWNKILQMKNGTTFFFHFTKKDGIDVTVFDKSRTIISVKEVTSELWDPSKMKTSKVEGLYEIGGQPVLFLQQEVDKTPTLFRIKFNALTGEVDGEKQISTLSRYKVGAMWAMVYGHVEPEDFYVEKDPASDNYAVINFNSFAHESDQRIEVVHYGIENGNHKILNRAFYDAQGFKYVKYIGMTVNADKDVHICTYGFNTASSGGKDSRVIISKLTKGSKEFVHKQLDFSDDFKDTRALMQYNPGTGMIQLYTLTLYSGKHSMWSGKTTSTYLPLLSFIDSESLTIISTKPMYNEGVASYIANNFNSEKPYTGMPQHMIINSDHTTTIVNEEMFKTVMLTKTGGATVTEDLGNIAVTELDTKGTELRGYAIKKNQRCYGDISPFHIGEKAKGLWKYQQKVTMYGINAPYFSFDYVSTDKNRYVIFNDFVDNYYRADNEKKKLADKASNTSTVCFNMKDGKVNKYFLFGTPKDDDDLKFIHLESSDYRADISTYATLMITKEGRKKQARIAWIKFD